MVAYFIAKFYRGSLPNISHIDDWINRAELCEHLLEEFRQEAFATDQTTMSGILPENPEVIHRRNCKRVRVLYESAEMGSIEPDDVEDPRNGLLQLMVAASPHDTVSVEILNNHDQIRENMTSQFEIHFTGENYGNFVKMIDNVPDAVTPVKASPVYFQLPDGDKTMLVQAWLVSAPNSISGTDF
jgi:extracellular elastinolytic metalloproteinase